MKIPRSRSLLASLVVVGATFPAFVVSTPAGALSGAWTVTASASSQENQSAIRQPLNADGSSNFKNNGRVVPVQFDLKSRQTPILESLLGDADPNNDFGSMSFTPSSALAFGDITTLKADYSFLAGNCGGGALRWSIRVSSTQSVFVYYGAAPNFTDCTTVNQSAVNLASLGDLRVDTSQVGGTFYDTWAHAVVLVGTMPIVRASLVLDAGWVADQRVKISSATVNDNVFAPVLASTCNLPAAAVRITKGDSIPSGSVNDSTSIQPADTNGVYRVVDCKYLYNLATSSLTGVGTYWVEVVIGGTPVPGAVAFDLK